jgi:hypothetical protein
MAERRRLPDRRPNVTVEVNHGGFRLAVTVGFDLGGRPLEVFASGTRIGTDLGHVLADACVLMSLALQHGCPPERLVRTLGRVPEPGGGAEASRPASVVGAVAAVTARIGQDIENDGGTG